MTKKEYESKLMEIMAKYRDEVYQLQEQYIKEYKSFHVGDLCRDKTGFKCYFIVQKVRHIRNNGDIYTVLDGETTNKKGETHYGSRKDTFRDTEAMLIRHA